MQLLVVISIVLHFFVTYTTANSFRYTVMLANPITIPRVFSARLNEKERNENIVDLYAFKYQTRYSRSLREPRYLILTSYQSKTCADEPFPGWTGHSCVVCKCNLQLSPDQTASQLNVVVPMTISYNLDVSTSHPWTLISLLYRWKGSIWKAVYVEYGVWLLLYFIISTIYRFLLSEEQQYTFAAISAYSDTRLSYIPMDLILGFFVTAILNRFYTIYKIIGFMDNIALLTSVYVRGTTERAVYFRRSIIRFVQINQVLVFRDLSMRARKRFPTLDTVVAAGFMTEEEKERFDEIQYKYSKYWLPIQWALATTYHARREGFIESDYYAELLSQEIKQFRTDIAWLCNYDWVPLPLIYPTIVCLMVHVYFLVCVIGRQFTPLPGERSHIDLVFPIMTSIQFILYMGWLKVGEQLLNPWGEDDDDFETNMLVDRNLAMGLKIVDEGYGGTPVLKRDAFWDNEWEPMYEQSVARQLDRDIAPEGSTLQNVKLPSSTAIVRMVPHGSLANLERITSRSRIVPVHAHDKRRMSSMDVLRDVVKTRSIRLHSVANFGRMSENQSSAQLEESQPSTSTASNRRRTSFADVVFTLRDRRNPSQSTVKTEKSKEEIKEEQEEEEEKKAGSEGDAKGVLMEETVTTSVEVLPRPDSLVDGDNELLSPDERRRMSTKDLATCEF